jgi:hydroxymethylpyrimidine pyrophosphatase-like HAD family hydrolase
MRYLALATDYDGTLAHDGRVDAPTLAGLERLLASGRRLIMVTGRELDDLIATFDHLALFERVVAENGALLYHPAEKAQRILAPAPAEEFVRALRNRGVPLSAGRAIVATWKPYETAVLATIRDLGLDSQVIFNKDAVMVLPAGVTKATGLQAALEELGLSSHNVVGVGDAENDHAFLRTCECAVAVANALPALKQMADFTTRGDHGAGVVELIDEVIIDDLAGRDSLLGRHHVVLGMSENGAEVEAPAYACNLLIAGPSGGVQSTLTIALLEQLSEAGYQFCVIDPAGDFKSLDGAMTVGGREQPPTVEQTIQLLGDPKTNVVVDLVGLPVADRPSFFSTLVPQLRALRERTGRPHWIVVDETRHLMPYASEPPRPAVPRYRDGASWITVRADALAMAALTAVDTVIALGDDPVSVLIELAAAVGVPTPEIGDAALGDGEILIWQRQTGRGPFKAKAVLSEAQRREESR